jgi:hypothetical protein
LFDYFQGLLTTDSQSQMRPELARELWERISDILSGHTIVNKQQSRTRPQSGNNLNDKLSVIDLQHFLLNLTHPTLIQILFSLLSRFYSLILVEQSHVDIHSDYVRYWPTSIDYRQRSIRSSTVGQLIQALFQHIQRLKYLPIHMKASLYRTQADIHLTLQQHTSAMHVYMSSIAMETTLFTSSNISQQDDSMIRNMIRASMQLGNARCGIVAY